MLLYDSVRKINNRQGSDDRKSRTWGGGGGGKTWIFRTDFDNYLPPVSTILYNFLILPSIVRICEIQLVCARARSLMGLADSYYCGHWWRTTTTARDHVTRCFTRSRYRRPFAAESAQRTTVDDDGLREIPWSYDDNGWWMTRGENCDEKNGNPTTVPYVLNRTMTNGVHGQARD